MEYLDCSSEPVYTPLLTSKSGVSECDEDFSQLQIAVEKQKPVDVKETFPETEDYMLQLSRLQDKVASFYQLPELNNKPGKIIYSNNIFIILAKFQSTLFHVWTTSLRNTNFRKCVNTAFIISRSSPKNSKRRIWFPINMRVRKVMNKLM